MRLYPIICLGLLAGCGRESIVPPDLLVPPTGYQGKTPQTEGQFFTAVATDKKALGQCVLQLETIKDILE
jgi:hypothetical protein